MTDTPSPPSRPPKPKRGAFPTPKSQIDEAPPYVPDVEEPAEDADGERTPGDGDGEPEH